MIILPLQSPKSQAVLGAQIQKPLGKGALHRQRYDSPQQIH